MDEFQQYQSFANAEVAQSLLTLLRHHQIVYETALDEPAFSLNMAHNPTDTRFVVRLRPEDFEAARQLEDELNQHLTAGASPDHYLFGFTDDELFEILVKPDEWNSYDVTLASQILRDRGRAVTPDAVRLLQRHRVAEMARAEPENLDYGWLSVCHSWRVPWHAHWVAPASASENAAQRHGGLRLFGPGPCAGLANLCTGNFWSVVHHPTAND